MLPEIVWWWVSCDKFTVTVKCKDDIIIESAPITKKFIGQHINNLKNWVHKKFEVNKICKMK